MSQLSFFLNKERIAEGEANINDMALPVKVAEVQRGVKSKLGNGMPSSWMN
jgi:hypothetical protein